MRLIWTGLKFYPLVKGKLCTKRKMFSNLQIESICRRQKCIKNIVICLRVEKVWGK